jgi:hypothetical protein
MVSLLGGTSAGPPVALVGLIGHGISGPIVHLAHGRPLAALGSLGLEAGLPALTVGLALGPTCTGNCVSQFWWLLIATPIALSIGTAVDSAALAWEDRPKVKPTVSVAPLVLPPLRMGTLHLPSPAGAALVGTF